MAGDEEQTWPRKQEANEYLQQHKIMELFNNLTSQLMYDRPDNPKEYLIQSLEALQKARTTRMDYPCLFDDSNIESIFKMLDPTGRGFITKTQYIEALNTIGVKGFDESPPGGEADKVTMDTFLREAKAGLMEASATFHK